MNKENPNLTESLEIFEFISSANEFCDLVDNAKNYKNVHFMQYLYELLLKVIIHASKLPEIDSPNFFKKTPKITWKENYSGLGKKLKKYDRYLEIFDPYDFNDKEPVDGSLADDICDIYGDLKAGLENWDKSTTKIRKNIIWSWKNNFEIHWGEHATGALRALYIILFRKIDNDDGFPIALRK